MSRHTPAGPPDEYERAVAASIETFGSAARAVGEHSKEERPGRQSRGGATTIFRRLPEPQGPLTVFGYNYFASHAKAAGVPTPRLLSYQGEWGGGEEYAYEALNFADGTRTAQQIDAELSAEYGPIPTDLVVEYMKALRKIGVVQ